MATPLPFTNGFYDSPVKPLSAQRCVNWYVNAPEAPAVTNECLLGTPGAVEVANVGTQATARGGISSAGKPYFVIGEKFYRVDVTYDIEGVPTYTPVELGTISGSGRVSLAENGDQIVIVVPGSTAYVYSRTLATFYTISDPNYDGPAENVSFIDGFFVFAKTDDKKFFNSPLNDAKGSGNGGAAYNALDFSNAEADPDPIVGTISYRNQLYVFGTETIEVYRNIARVPSPFERVNGFIIPKGLRAANSLTRFASTFAWIGGGRNEKPSVYVFDGNGAQRISTRPIDYILGQLSDDELSNIGAWAYEDSGSFFVGFSLPDICLVYDATANRWHERSSTNFNVDVPYRSTDFVSAYGVLLCGDRLTGIIGEVSGGYLTEYGRLIKRTFTTQPFDLSGDVAFVPRIEALIESGVGLMNDISVLADESTILVGSDPKIGMEFSDDGGRTFSNMRFRSMGKTGKYRTRCIWNRNGRISRNRVLRFTMSAPVPAAFLRLEAEIIG